MNNLLDLASTLIAKESITPNDNGCQAIIQARLEKLGFDIKTFQHEDVTNLWARHGTQEPLLIFAGHTDVVPPGPLDQWSSPPFTPTITDGKLYGRGAADMKSSIAAMITACEQFIEEHPRYAGSIAFLITSDEEGPAINGTCKVVEHLQAQNVQADWCLVGEATSHQKIADTIKVGRRGSLSGQLVIHGKQGHIAYPHLATNPIPIAANIIAELNGIKWDQGNLEFPATSLQISNIHAGTGANNVIPADIIIDFNFRYCPSNTAHKLKQLTQTIIQKHHKAYNLTWNHSAHPYHSTAGKLREAVQTAIQHCCGYEAKISTDGGTSDGRFMATLGCEVIELGPLNNTIHQVNEHIFVDNLKQLSKIYTQLLTTLFC